MIFTNPYVEQFREHIEEKCVDTPHEKQPNRGYKRKRVRARKSGRSETKKYRNAHKKKRKRKKRTERAIELRLNNSCVMSLLREYKLNAVRCGYHIHASIVICK